MRALVIGMGGLGCPASLVLAAAGVERLTLADPDLVELSNLHRQPWHTDADLGTPKVDSAASKLLASFPTLAVRALPVAVTADIAGPLFRAHDVVLDCTDRAPTKFMLNDAALEAGVPLIYAGVLRLEGLAMRVVPGGPCLRCVFEEEGLQAPTCAQVGVLGPMAGWVGAAQGTLALGQERGVLHRFDGASLQRRAVAVRRADDCQACGRPPMTLPGGP